MRANRNGWRLLTAIVQIAAFLLFVLPAPAQAAMHRHAGLHAHLGQASVDHRHTAPTGLVAAVSGPADVTPDPAAGHDTCRLGCCACHTFVEASPGVPGRTAWSAQRLPVPIPDATRPDATPEALPEPPRSCA